MRVGLNEALLFIYFLNNNLSFYFFKRFLFIHERRRERERERERERLAQRHRQREKQAPCREPDVGLNPGTLGSCPEPKADAHPLSHPGAPISGTILLVGH